ncbi:MAG: hypothetical protein V7661_14200, partial [Sulfitobacter sp.]
LLLRKKTLARLHLHCAAKPPEKSNATSDWPDGEFCTRRHFAKLERATLGMSVIWTLLPFNPQ